MFEYFNDEIPTKYDDVQIPVSRPDATLHHHRVLVFVTYLTTNDASVWLMAQSLCYEEFAAQVET